MKGIIFDIQKFCVHDGPGIRTTVFLKGCMMRCKWCHNPESLSLAPQLSFDRTKCINCGECMKSCNHHVHDFKNDTHSVNFESCIGCGACISECSVNALKLIGNYAEAGEVIDEVLKDKKYYDNSCGGVTFSGGEPTIQFEFLLELLELSKKNNLHVCLETNGLIERSRLKSLLEYVDLFLFDYKLTDTEKHKHLTGVSNELILENLDFLNKNNHPLILRCPVIPGFNDDERHFDAIKAIKRKYINIIKSEIMPYHNIGSHKWEQLGYAYTLSSLANVSDIKKFYWETLTEDEGIEVIKCNSELVAGDAIELK